MLFLANAPTHALPPMGMLAPFAILLLCIALMPLFAAHFWEHHYPKVAVGLGLVTGAYYALVQHDWHPLHHAANEYVSFMALVGSLFVISGGISIRVKGEATPLVNTLYLLLGAVLANFIGTTGASMLLIRPWIQMNRFRITGFHIVFFIFIVSNVGGCLTPIGDPPLFLGFLRGVSFFWVLQHCWQDLAAALAHRPDILTDFIERRRCSFKRQPVELTGEVRFSAAHGLSLHYLTPEERIVVLDGKGLRVQVAAGGKTPPADPRAEAASSALLDALRLDLPALAGRFEIYGRRTSEAWALALALLLGAFFILDMGNFSRIPKKIRDEETAHEDWNFSGLFNVVWLGVVLGAVFLPKSVQETTFLGVFSIPALVMFAAAAASYFTTKPTVHEANDFNFGPVKEVGFLFVGIFLTMIPALQILQSGEALQISSPMQYYFTTGALSAFLDNAPTYLSFLAASMGQQHLSVDSPADVMKFAAEHAPHLIAISLGAVFFGAGSYIGNGPNFMVKSIADKSKVNAPSFLAYMLRFSIPILLPILALVGWIMVKNSH